VARQDCGRVAEVPRSEEEGFQGERLLEVGLQTPGGRRRQGEDVGVEVGGEAEITVLVDEGPGGRRRLVGAELEFAGVDGSGKDDRRRAVGET
jgi:hypothetical protein